MNPPESSSKEDCSLNKETIMEIADEEENKNHSNQIASKIH